jgi:hypothetical protein
LYKILLSASKQKWVPLEIETEPFKPERRKGPPRRERGGPAPRHERRPRLDRVSSEGAPPRLEGDVVENDEQAVEAEIGSQKPARSSQERQGRGTF